jgi:hypothetical protein
MIITSVVVLAIVGSAFAFNAKKTQTYCVTTSGGSGNCYTIAPSRRTTGAGVTLKYVECWDPIDVCTSTSPCSTTATFVTD